MFKLLLPIVLMLTGTGVGVGAAILLQPAPAGDEAAASAPPEVVADTGAAPEFARMNNQFVVPVVSDNGMEALVVMAISLEVMAGHTSKVHSREPKLRDAFLRVLFDHANIGGFDGAFTRAENMNALRRALVDTARSVVGPEIRDVLILDIARQRT
ncbi:MAG: flagellar basal body-associated FliL family protein [Rhodobacteraceae bacterium]|nr:flagellar basal body-associated FliL family protein [Paracoccaceae bacterium]